MVRSSWFNFCMTLSVLLNTITLAIYHYPMSDDLSDTLSILNFIFTIIFVAEMALKIFGLGFKGYFTDMMNLFDAFVVFLSIIEITAL